MRAVLSVAEAVILAGYVEKKGQWVTYLGVLHGGKTLSHGPTDSNTPK